MRSPSPGHSLLPLALLLGSGCVTPVGNAGDIDAVEEILVSGGVTGARAVAGHHTFVGSAEGLVHLQEGGAPRTLAAADAPPVGAVAHAGELLVLTEDGLSVVAAGQLASTPLADALDGPPLEMVGAGGALWLRTAGGVWLLRAGTLNAVAVDGRALTGPLAAAVAEDGTPMAWIGAEDALVAVDAAGNVRAEHAGPVEAVAADATYVWAVAEGELLRGAEAGPWRRYALPAPVGSVAADPGVAGAWLTTDAGVFRVVDDTFEALAGGLAPEGIAADPLGRLLAWDGEDLHRVTAGRVVAVVGLDDGDEVEGLVHVTLHPTAPDDIASLTVTVDGAALVVTEAEGTWTAALDAVDFAGAAEHSFVATASYTGGQAATTSVRFTVGALGDVGWAAHVAPLHEARCAICHEGDTVTILDGPEAWEAAIDDVLAQVTAGAMPLAGDPLTDGEIAVITAWRDGGFLP